ncbi:MAG TPA: cation-efflux pump [Solirubrobacteraceae bacterium]|jgi:cation diffusion facilitator family transporter|nr:cation-efflux pump [Solirubrobacteraceae bacterium]
MAETSAVTARAADATDAAGQRRTTVVSIITASSLMVLMLGVGLATSSLGLISTGIESTGDVVAAVVTFFAVRLGARPADESHPFGHRRAENLSALAEASILLGGGVIVVIEAVQRLIGNGSTLTARWYVFAVIGVAIVVNTSRAVIARRSARRYGSTALRSNSFHFAGDVGGSIAVLVGLIAVRAGFHDGDAISALIVAGLIFTAAARLIFENAQVLMDTAPAHARAVALDAIATLAPGVELDRLRLRESGGRYFADVVVAIPPGQAVVEAHATADTVEHAIEHALPNSDVVVHVEPRRRGLTLRDRVLAIALSEPDVSEAHDITIFDHGDQRSVSLHLKLPADSSLATAHEVAERVERAIGALPTVSDVRTHLEPLEQPIAADPSAGEDPHALETIKTVVQRYAHTPARDLRLLPTPEGEVLFITVSVGATASLDQAHQLASELEEELRQELPSIADVVVHTEP